MIQPFFILLILYCYQDQIFNEYYSSTTVFTDTSKSNAENGGIPMTPVWLGLPINPYAWDEGSIILTFPPSLILGSTSLHPGIVPLKDIEEESEEDCSITFPFNNLK